MGEPVMFFRGAMDADQKRDVDGKFGAGGSSNSHKEHETYHRGAAEHHQKEAAKHMGSSSQIGMVRHYQGIQDKHLEAAHHFGAAQRHSEMGRTKEAHASRSHAEKLSKKLGPGASEGAHDEEMSASMSGEAGRIARKQARDCMSGRYRP